MADSPIHDLPAASTVAGTDVVPIDQGVTTRKATMTQISAAIGPINVGVGIHGANSITTPSDPDELGIVDTADGNTLKKLTWANLKATLLTYFSALTGTWAISTTGNAATATTTTGNAGSATKLQTARNLDVTPFDGTANVTIVAPAIHAATNKGTPVDADEVGIWDSVSGLLNKVTWANIKTTLASTFATLAALAASGGSALIGFLQAGTGAVGTTVQAKLRETISVADFGAVGDGITDDFLAIQAAINHTATVSGVLKLVHGKTYYISDSLLPKSSITIDLNGATITTNDGTDIFIFAMQDDPFSVLTYYNLDIGVNYVIGETVLTMATAGDAANFTAGDYIWIRCKGISAPIQSITPVAELNRVLSVTNEFVTLEYPLSKDYTYDASYTYGVAKVGTNFIHDFHVTGFGTLDATATRAFQVLEAFNCSVTRITMTGAGGGLMRGRFNHITDNTIKLTPDWASGWRPHYWAWDTGQSDSVFERNKCSSTGMGIMHMHEGTGNCHVINNSFEQGETDAGTAEVWPVVSIQAFSWNGLITNNTIVNGPLDSGIYVDQGNKSLTITQNTLSGTYDQFGISAIGNNNNTNFIVAGNTIKATLNGTGNYAINITQSGGPIPDPIFEQNQTGTSPNNITGVTYTRSIRTNFYGSLLFTPLTGTPALTLWRGGRGIIYAFDAAAVEAVCGTFALQEIKRTELKIRLWWTNLGAGSGDVIWIVFITPFINGDNANVGDTLSVTAAITAPAQDYVQVSDLGTITIGDTDAFLHIRILRSATGAGDTLANDAGVIGVQIG